jgi:thiol-disulfide isomerase/thioredoxin
MPAKTSSESRAKHAGLLPKILILAGIVLLVAVVYLLKNQPTKVVAPVDKLPETQLDWYLENHQPVFVFFHSTTCQTCIEMMGVVEQIYPEFKDQVGLVDVNVYQSWNEELLRRAKITNIPTQVFINEKGEGKTMIGGMQPDELRAELQALAEGASRGD